MTHSNRDALLELAPLLRRECLPVFQHPCGRREVVVGIWGHMLAHPTNCPDCQASTTPNKDEIDAR